MNERSALWVEKRRYQRKQQLLEQSGANAHGGAWLVNPSACCGPNVELRSGCCARMLALCRCRHRGQLRRSARAAAACASSAACFSTHSADHLFMWRRKRLVSSSAPHKLASSRFSFFVGCLLPLDQAGVWGQGVGCKRVSDVWRQHQGVYGFAEGLPRCGEMFALHAVAFGCGCLPQVLEMHLRILRQVPQRIQPEVGLVVADQLAPT